jgi:hypothetical protein
MRKKNVQSTEVSIIRLKVLSAIFTGKTKENHKKNFRQNSSLLAEIKTQTVPNNNKA